MAGRTLNLRQGVMAGVAMSIFFTLYSTAQAPADDRVVSFVFTAITCALFVGLVLLVALALQARQRRG